MTSGRKRISNSNSMEFDGIDIAWVNLLSEMKRESTWFGSLKLTKTGKKEESFQIPITKLRPPEWGCRRRKSTHLRQPPDNFILGCHDV